MCINTVYFFNYLMYLEIMESTVTLQFISFIIYYIICPKATPFEGQGGDREGEIYK